MLCPVSWFHMAELRLNRGSIPVPGALYHCPVGLSHPCNLEQVHSSQLAGARIPTERAKALSMTGEDDLAQPTPILELPGNHTRCLKHAIVNP